MELIRRRGIATYITFPIVDADGDFVTSAASLDSEIDAWADGTAPDGFTDCTNEATEIGTTGIYYLLLTATEMAADYIAVQVKTGTAGAKTQMVLISTKPAGVMRRNTAQGGAAGSITLDASASATDDAYNGFIVETVGGTGRDQVRTITDYNGSTKVATVDRNWVTNPDNTTIFDLYPGSLGNTLSEIGAQAATDVHTTAMAEAYSTDGSAATLAQAVYLIMQMLTEASVSGTTLTVKKLDGSTTAATFTLNDASSPTSITRAT